MKFKWYGHSCFLLTCGDGTRILTDPCAPTTGYTLQRIACSAVTGSHAHYDHNYFVAATGAPRVLTEAGETTVGGARITALPTYHDKNHGKDRGKNLIFVFEDTSDGLRVAHLGDLGHMPEEDTLLSLGRIDVLLCPVGGVFTIDAAEARAVANRIRPRVLIPMHYKTPALTFDLAGLDPLLLSAKDCLIQRLNDSECIITPDTLLGGDRIVIFDYDKD